MGGLRRGNEGKEPGELRVGRGNARGATRLGGLPLRVSEHSDGCPRIGGADGSCSRRYRDSEGLEVVSVLVEDWCQLETELRERCNKRLVLGDECLLCPGNLGGDRVVSGSRGCSAVTACPQNPGACDASPDGKDGPTAHVLFEFHRHTMAWVFARLNAGRLSKAFAAQRRQFNNRSI